MRYITYIIRTVHVIIYCIFHIYETTKYYYRKSRDRFDALTFSNFFFFFWMVLKLVIDMHMENIQILSRINVRSFFSISGVYLNKVYTVYLTRVLYLRSDIGTYKLPRIKFDMCSSHHQQNHYCITHRVMCIFVHIVLHNIVLFLFFSRYK